MKSYLPKFLIILTLLILYIFITAKSYANSIFNELNNNIFRLHILANSNSDEDQNLKLKVRDEIINYIEDLTSSCKNKEEVIEKVSESVASIKTICENVIKENGYDYSVNIEIGSFYFPTKYYGNISMPEGIYDALKINIGKAEGNNWWCSLFPPLCFTDISSGIIDEDSNELLKSNLDDEEYNIITKNSTTIKFKFKLIELLNN